MKVVKLPSGAELQITPAPFADAKALYQAMLEELKSIKISGETDLEYGLMKDIFCGGFSSPRIEAALAKCLARATYSGTRISDEVFEKVEARQDYIIVCYEVALENVLPFTKSLYAQFEAVKGMLKSSLA
jgi:hypothetical protein